MDQRIVATMMDDILLYRRRRRAAEVTTLSITTQPSNNEGYSDNYANLEFTVVATSTNTSYTGNMTISKKSGSGTLSGTTTVAAVAGVATFDDLAYSGTDAAVFTVTPADTGAAGEAVDTASETFLQGDDIFVNEWDYYDDVIDYGIVNGATQTGGGGSDFEWVGEKSVVNMLQATPSAKPSIDTYTVNFSSDTCNDSNVTEVRGVDNLSILFVSTTVNGGNNIYGAISDGTIGGFSAMSTAAGTDRRATDKRGGGGTKISSIAGAPTESVSYRASFAPKNAAQYVRENTSRETDATIDNSVTDNDLGFGLGAVFASQPYTGNVYLWCVASSVDFTDATVYAHTKSIVNSYLTSVGAGVQLP